MNDIRDELQARSAPEHSLLLHHRKIFRPVGPDRSTEPRPLTFLTTPLDSGMHSTLLDFSEPLRTRVNSWLFPSQTIIHFAPQSVTPTNPVFHRHQCGSPESYFPNSQPLFGATSGPNGPSPGAGAHRGMQRLVAVSPWALLSQPSLRPCSGPVPDARRAGPAISAGVGMSTQNSSGMM